MRLRVAVIGCGYVGLSAAAVYAHFGNSVVAVESDASRLDTLRAGEVPFFEPGLEAMIAAQSVSGRLVFTSDLAAAVGNAEVVVVAVGTPAKENGEADLDGLFAAVRELAPVANSNAVVVIKSTVPVGTGDVVEAILRRARPDAWLPVVANPEFLREGRAVADMLQPSRVVVGTSDVRARARLETLYAPLSESCPLLFTSRRTAELIKSAANAYLATRLSFINELADLCETVDADIGSVALGMGLDPRIGRDFLQPGPGFGGACLPKDAAALLQTAQSIGKPLHVLSAAVTANAERKSGLIERVRHSAGRPLAGLTVAVLGLSFKPGTDDMRESPALELVPALQRDGARLQAFDPAANEAAGALLQDVSFAADPYTAALHADIVVLLTDWPELKVLDLERLRERMQGVVFVDLRNAYEPATLAAAGFEAFTIGKAPRFPRNSTRMPADGADGRFRTVATDAE